jgi:predicted membrane GTPase involved in stress response
LTGSEKKRGPKPKIRPSEVVNRAYDLRLTFDVARKELDWSKVLAAQSREEVVAAFEQMSESYRRKFLSKPELILKCLKDPKFPKQNRKAQEEFIADSLAGDGRISIRRSRDICGEDRTKEKRQGKILRREFYIECSCGYKGPAFHDACPGCGAVVSYLDFATGFTFGGYS